MYKFLVAFFRVITKIIFRIKVVDLRTEKKDEPYIICANHISNWDPIFLAVALPFRLYFMSKAELMKVPVLKQLMVHLEMIPVHREDNDITAIKKSISTVKSQKHFCIFPQGTRCRDGLYEEQFKNGAAFIASGSNSGILPVAIYTKNYRVKLFSKIYVIVGEPLTYGNLGFEENRKNYDYATKIIAERIIDLSKKGV